MEKVNSQKGFTIIEILVSVGILTFLLLVIGQVYFLIINQTTYYREQTVIASLSDQYMEVARNLSYAKVGTLNGNPHGNLNDLAEPKSVTVNGTNYSIYYAVGYVDDTADGTILLGTDPAPNDYKQVKLYIKNTRTDVTTSFFTNIVPKGLEGLTSGGALYVKVFDAVGQPVSGATVRIQNAVINPDIDLTRTTDANGNWLEVGLPNSSNSYHITVTKSGYSSDQTYSSSVANPNPTKPDATISNGQVTQISFSIDRVSNLTFNIEDQVCSPISGTGLNVIGAKLIGTPNVLKFNNNYTSNGSGQVPLTNIEWDSYTPTLSSSTYMVYGSSPIQQVNILPNTSQNFTLIVGPKTNHSLLVIVKDASTQNAIEGASVRLEKTSSGLDITKYTSGSIWGQQNWSGGSGQANFINVNQYDSDNGSIDNAAVPSGISLTSFNGGYNTPGILVSSVFDTGSQSTGYTTLEWRPTSQNPATILKFQLASSATNDQNTNWDFSGPDGTANTYYTVSGSTISNSLDNKRYVRYKAFLSTTDTSKTPVLTSLNLNYVSGCFTPGQAMFEGLSQGEDYQVTISNSGYQTQTISNSTINGYGVLQILLSQ